MKYNGNGFAGKKTLHVITVYKFFIKDTVLLLWPISYMHLSNPKALWIRGAFYQFFIATTNTTPSFSFVTNKTNVNTPHLDLPIRIHKQAHYRVAV